MFLAVESSLASIGIGLPGILCKAFDNSPRAMESRSINNKQAWIVGNESRFFGCNICRQLHLFEGVTMEADELLSIRCQSIAFPLISYARFSFITSPWQCISFTLHLAAICVLFNFHFFLDYRSVLPVRLKKYAHTIFD